MAHPIQFVKRECSAFMRFVDKHPRVGWYIASITTVNLLLNALQLLQ